MFALLLRLRELQGRLGPGAAPRQLEEEGAEEVEVDGQWVDCSAIHLLDPGTLGVWARYINPEVDQNSVDGTSTVACMPSYG